MCFAACLSAQDNASEQEQALRAAVERVAPSVVKIETIGGLERVGKVLVATGPTTGLVVGADGYVISSAFNFIQQPSSILVTLPSGKRAAAKIVARDKSRMLVLLKVNAGEKLAVPEATPRSEMTVGQWAIAVGRTYDQRDPNISVGVLSATNRIWSTAIQTDAKISPANYGGPLIDIYGRVLGVLVPLSPQKQGGEVAGAEWYDSGIGFAIPLADIFQRLPTMQAGKDVHPGLLGVSLKPGDMYALPAELVGARPASPAYKAGLKAGDTIVELNGQPITRIAQLKHALGPRDAGEKVHFVITRGPDKTRHELDIELVASLPTYHHPFLGILPLRDGAGVRVRYVYPGSPAETAGVKPGDSVAALADTKVNSADELRTLVANLEPKAQTTLKIERGGETLSLELTPGVLPVAIPGELPAALSEKPPEPAEKPATGLVEIKLPEEKNECVAFVPATYHPAVPHGVLVVIPAPGAVDRQKLADRWQALAEERQFIVLSPMSAAGDRWQATESAFIRKTLDDVVARYNIDRPRIAVYGQEAGGPMAYLAGFEHIDRVRAIIGVNAAPPQRLTIPDNDPLNRLALFIAAADKSPSAAILKQFSAHLIEEKFPVTQLSLGEQPRELTADELTELGRWLDALDRI